MSEEALRESRRERIRERITWLKNNFDEINLRLAVAAMTDASEYNFSADNDILDHIIDDPRFASSFAEMLEVDADLLISEEQIPKEEFLSKVAKGLED